MKTIGVDPACVDLARHFLMAEPVARPIGATEAAANLQSLAEEIQVAVEDWFTAQELNAETPTDD